MGSPMIDKLEMSKDLVRSGMDREQAEGVANAFEKAIRGVLATKADLEVACTRLESGIRQDMVKMEVGIRQDMAKMEAGIRQDMAKMGQDMAKMQASLIRWMFAMWITGIGVLTAVLELKP
ncbi:hypothetical protein Acaty_m0137 (plasmid) [Acidithiobacillus caldus ATCC 51756]|jgi:hypothetical protein|uniref:DUF1640 domain-containing protein n=2 Tax=Acidithiobacillus caldus TaxID=33059 RepID=A0A059ZYY7_ACICK|nr:hypothetical protein Acaty_m0137 [Acidithiobacillus caldus ATCC 51756]